MSPLAVILGLLALGLVPLGRSLDIPWSEGAQWALWFSLATWLLFRLVQAGMPQASGPARRRLLMLVGVVGSGIGVAWLARSGASPGIDRLVHLVVVGGAPLWMGALAVFLDLVHELCAREGLSWRQTIERGWRRSLQLRGQASKAEHWGFLLFAAWALPLTILLLEPLGRLAMQFGTACFAIPCATVMLRRFFAYSIWERVVMVLALALWVLSYRL
jgi:hypothetical protein